MKKLLKLFALLLVFGILAFSVACEDEVTIESISVVESSIPSEVLINDIDEIFNKIKIDVKKSDDSVETINLNKSMISEDDYNKLSAEGEHTIKVTYDGKEVTITINVKKPKENQNPDPEKEPINYSIEIVDIAGKPLSGFYVMFYKGEDIVAEGYTKNGIFETELVPDKYEVSNIPFFVYPSATISSPL